MKVSGEQIEVYEVEGGCQGGTTGKFIVIHCSDGYQAVYNLTTVFIISFNVMNTMKSNACLFCWNYRDKYSLILDTESRCFN